MMAAEAPMSRNNAANPMTSCAIPANPYARCETSRASTVALITWNTCCPARDNATQLAPETTASPVPPEADSGIRSIHCRVIQSGARALCVIWFHGALKPRRALS